MKILDVIQGSPQWLAARAQHNTASEAPAVMGASKYLTRTELLHQKATGITPEVDAHKQALFDRGHAAEAAARVLVEEMIGNDLYPITAVCEQTNLLASLDGLTMDESTAFECKLWNEDLAAQVRAGDLAPHYYWQLEQELLVSRAEKVIFVTSDGTMEKFAHCEYRAVPGRREQLIAAWAQFDKDLAAYVPPAASAVEKIVAEPVEQLPAPVVQVTGTLALVDNFKVFEERLRDFLANKLIRKPKNDEDFVNLDAQIKAMKGARVSVKGAKAAMLAQVDPVDRANKTADMLDALLQQNISIAEKLLGDEKDRRKLEIVTGGATAFKAHIDGLNQRLGKPYMPAIQTLAHPPIDFGGVVKGLKSLTSMEDKVAGELARAKIAANEAADKIQLNLEFLREHAKDHAFLFADTGTIVLKADDDFQTLVRARITEHKAEQARQEEATRARIRAEEQARADKEARDRLAAEQAERDRVASEQAAAAAEAAKPAATPAPPAAASPALSSQAPAPNVVQMPRATTAPAAPASPPTLTLGAIKERLAPALSTDAAGLAALGFTPAATQGAARLFHERDWPLMLAAMVRHLESVQAKAAA